MPEGIFSFPTYKRKRRQRRILYKVTENYSLKTRDKQTDDFHICYLLCLTFINFFFFFGFDYEKTSLVVERVLCLKLVKYSIYLGGHQKNIHFQDLS